MKKIKVLVNWAGGNYAATASGEELDGSVLVTDKSFEKLREKFREAINFHKEGIVAGGDPVPVALRGSYDLKFELTTQALLRSVEDKMTFTALQKASGINVKQLSHYATGEKNPRPAQRAKIVRGIHRIAAELSAVV